MKHIYFLAMVFWNHTDFWLGLHFISKWIISIEHAYIHVTVSCMKAWLILIVHCHQRFWLINWQVNSLCLKNSYIVSQDSLFVVRRCNSYFPRITMRQLLILLSCIQEILGKKWSCHFLLVISISRLSCLIEDWGLLMSLWILREVVGILFIDLKEYFLSLTEFFRVLLLF